MKPVPPEILVSLAIETDFGTFWAHYSRSGLARLNFPSSETPPLIITQLTRQWTEWQQLTTSALQTSLAGRPCPMMPPMDDSSGTEFQRQVWQGMCAIPMGQTLSYTELAANIGHPGATRAVGNACGANPIPVLIPCHRVLAAHGKLGGFSSGLPWKLRLLDIEGHSLWSKRAG